MVGSSSLDAVVDDEGLAKAAAADAGSELLLTEAADKASWGCDDAVALVAALVVAADRNLVSSIASEIEARTRDLASFSPSVSEET